MTYILALFKNHVMQASHPPKASVYSFTKIHNITNVNTTTAIYRCSNL